MNYPKYLLHRLMGVDIVKVFSLNAMATLVRMLTGMISIKVVAVIIGPVGIALLGQLNNFNTILLGMANGGIGSGVTKYVAEYKDDDNYIKKLLSNAFRITVVCSLIASLCIILGCVQISKWILMSEKYYYVFIVFGFTIILYTLNGLLITILNGYKHFKKYVKVNILGTVFGLIYSVALVTSFGLSGALINAVTFQSVIFFITLYMCRKEHWLKWEYFREKFDKAIARNYLGYSVMTLFALAMLPVSQMILRGYVISEISTSDAGIWEGMNRISGTYLSVITTAFSVYYLPRLSELTNNIELRNEILKCYKFVIPMLLAIGATIFLLRDFIIWFLFTSEFYPMSRLFGWQLAGDMFKMCSWLLSYLMVAKAMTKIFVVTEIAFNLSYLALAFLLMKINGIVGLTQGYLIAYIIYLIVMTIIFRNIIIVKKHA